SDRRELQYIEKCQSPRAMRSANQTKISISESRNSPRETLPNERSKTMKSLISGPSISDQQARFASPELTAFREFFEIKSKALAEKIMSDLDEQERALAAEQKARIESGLIDPAKYQEFVRLAQQVRHRREMSLELPHGFAGPKPPVGFQFLNTALVWPYTLVGDPVESHFMGMIAGNGPHHQLDSWGEA
ncbi:MAG: hypothetical protein WA637_06110, partial [Terriglobales bacterium]